MTLLRTRLQCKSTGEEKKVMSLKPDPIGPVPQETARLAKAVFPEGSTFIKMRDDAADALSRRNVRRLVSKRWSASAGSLAIGPGHSYAIR